jgi:DNA-binding response OmpR family regulator
VLSATAGGRPANVLLVDDDEDSTDLLRRLLVRRGFAVTTARSVAAALEAADAATVDVLVSDLGLPDGDGHDLLRQLRASRRLPAIALTGQDPRAAEAQRGEIAGFDEYLGKPVTIDRLVGALGRLFSDGAAG